MNKLVFIAAGLAVCGAASAANLIVWNYDNSTANTTTTTIGVIDPSPTSVDASIASVVFSTDAEGGLNTQAAGSPSTGSVGSFGGTVVNDPRATPAATGSIVMAGNGQDAGGVGTQTNNGKSIFYTITAASGSSFNLSGVSFAARNTSTGFNSLQVSYSTDGGTNYTNIGAAVVPTTTFAAYSVTGSASSLTSMILRITYNGATAGGGNARVDNLILAGSANAVPEPVTMAVLGLGALGVLRRRRKQR